MSMTECIDPELGNLLHLYELRALNEKDTERFESHIMKCPHCFREVSEFEKYSTALRFGKAAREAIRESFPEESHEPASRALRSRLWPTGPAYLKPGLMYIVILLMLVPAVLGLHRMFSTDIEIRPVQSINLAPTRIQPQNVFRKAEGPEGIISFVIPDADSRQHLQVSIIDQDGGRISTIDDFSQINQYGQGEILVPVGRLKPGIFRLIVAEPSGDSLVPVIEYRFKVNP